MRGKIFGALLKSEEKLTTGIGIALRLFVVGSAALKPRRHQSSYLPQDEESCATTHEVGVEPSKLTRQHRYRYHRRRRRARFL